MRVFAVLGSAPAAADRASVVDVGQVDLLLSFFDHPKAFTSIEGITQALKDKANELRNRESDSLCILSTGSTVRRNSVYRKILRSSD